MLKNSIDQLLHKATYFQKLASPDSFDKVAQAQLPFYMELLKAAHQTTKDFKDELVQLAQLYKAAVDTNAGFGYVKAYIDSIFKSHFYDDDEKDDEMDSLEDLLNEVYDDSMSKEENEDNANLDTFKEAFKAVKQKAYQKTLQQDTSQTGQDGGAGVDGGDDGPGGERIEEAPAGTDNIIGGDEPADTSADPNFDEPEGEEDETNEFEEGESKFDMSGNGAKEGEGKGYSVSKRALKDYVATYTTERKNYFDRLSKANENDKTILNKIIAVLDQLIPLRKTLDDLRYKVSILNEGQGLEERQALETVEQQYAAATAKLGAAKRAFRNQALAEENLKLDAAASKATTAAGKIYFKYRKLFNDIVASTDVNKSKQKKAAGKIVKLLAASLQTETLSDNILDRLAKYEVEYEEAAKDRITSEQYNIEQANKLRDVKDMAANYLTAPKKIDNRVYSPDNAPPIDEKSFAGLVKTFGHQIASGKIIEKQYITDPIVDEVKKHIEREELQAFRPYLEKLSNAKKALEDKAAELKSKGVKVNAKFKETLPEFAVVRLAANDLRNAMSEWVESVPTVAKYKEDSKIIIEIRDAFKTLEKQRVFAEMPLTEESKKKVLAVIAFVNTKHAELLKSNFKHGKITNSIDEIIAAMTKRITV